MKAGITHPCYYEPGVNRSYQQLAEHYQTAVIPARVGKARDKAKVEKAVQDIQRWILAPLRHRRFYSLAELNAAIQELLPQFNEWEMKSYEMSRRELFELTDKLALKPLPPTAFEYAEWKQAGVNLDYHIEVDKHYYSVPYQLVHKTVWVKILEKTIEVLHQEKRVALHQRSHIRFGHTTLEEHLPPEHAAIKNRTPERFLSQARAIGPETEKQVQAILQSKKHPEQAFRATMGVLRLAAKFSAERLEAACATANQFGIASYRRINEILKNKRDKLPAPTTSTAPIVGVHENLRGPQYFH